MPRDAALDTLLDLDGSILNQGGGYWIKLEASRVEVSAVVPHGIKYSLTLHDPSGQRIYGYDNAHVVKPAGRFKYAGRVLAADHRHRDASDPGEPYEFTSAQQLLEDFFRDVDRVLSGVRKP